MHVAIAIASAHAEAPSIDIGNGSPIGGPQAERVLAILRRASQEPLAA